MSGHNALERFCNSIMWEKGDKLKGLICPHEEILVGPIFGLRSRGIERCQTVQSIWMGA